MTDYDKIYQTQAIEYDQLIIREDYQNNLMPALNKICPLDGIDVIESGAGTGRLTTLLAPVVRRIRAFDASQHMLDQATIKLQKMGLQNWSLDAAGHDQIHGEPESADLFIAGWTMCYAALPYPDGWQAKLTQTLGAIKKMIRPGGTLIILETQGTGFETPTPPEPLHEYYHYLETEAGFSFTWIRTDYKFESLEEAERLSRFFFGDDLAKTVVENKWVIMPECTGIWWLHL
ncbi:MAG: class I SAM-dependent methyltransferase [Chloroflexota bacterium]